MNLPETRYVRAGDANLAYQVVGQGPVDLVLVPGFVSNLDVVARELNSNSTALQGVITNLNTVSGAFAANQASLREAIRELAPTLAVGRPVLAKLNRDEGARVLDEGYARAARWNRCAPTASRRSYVTP